MVNRNGILKDRQDAGRRLAELLLQYKNQPDCIVLGLPRGGIVVAYEVAVQLNLPLDACIVRKLGVPWQPELAMGAIATGGVRVLNDDVVRDCGISPAEIDAVATREQHELTRREQAYRPGQPFPGVAGKTVIVVDDGVATGATIRAAIQVIRQQGAARIVIAVGAAPPSTVRELEHEADQVVAVLTPEPFAAIGAWFQDFEQVSDAEVQQLLSRKIPARIEEH